MSSCFILYISGSVGAMKYPISLEGHPVPSYMSGMFNSHTVRQRSQMIMYPTVLKCRGLLNRIVNPRYGFLKLVEKHYLPINWIIIKKKVAKSNPRIALIPIINPR